MAESPKPAPPTETEKQWIAENREAIASINVFVERHGLLAARLRCRPEVK
jgi:post-segregation antitoxin (ccd killing protein)